MGKTGTNCAVYGCTNNYKKLKQWLDRECVDHLPVTKRHCGCPPRFKLYKKPADDCQSRSWLKNLNLNKPPKQVFVCSFHFIDKKPTAENPSPELYLGYERKVSKRRVLKRCRPEHVSEEDVEKMSKKSKKAKEAKEASVRMVSDDLLTDIKSSGKASHVLVFLHASTPWGAEVKVESEAPTVSSMSGAMASKSSARVKEEEEDQSVESSLQVKMSSGSPAGTVSDKCKLWDHQYCCIDQPVESRVQVKMSSPATDNSISIQQEPNHLGINTKLPVTKNTCDQCGKSCVTRQRLTIHQRTHTGERPYQCDQCGRMVSSISELTSHLLIHTGIKPHQCDQCEKRFRTSGMLKTHKKIHSGEKPYQCDQCGKSCSIIGNLKSHMRIHTGEKPYQCHLCGQRFSQSSSLKTHQRNHTF